VGCVLVNDNRHVIATGYNGAPAGMLNCSDPDVGCQCLKRESGKDLDQCVAVHAEENALIQVKNAFEIHDCFTTTFPCKRCLRMLMNTSCVNIYYYEEYSGILESVVQWQKSSIDRYVEKLYPERYEI
jgi:dCMP deaminase